MQFKTKQNQWMNKTAWALTGLSWVAAGAATAEEEGGALRPLGELRPTLEEFGFEFELGLTSVFQIASDSAGPEDQLFSYSFDFAGTWTLVEDSPVGSGGLGWLLEGGQPIFQGDDNDLGADAGVTLGLSDDLDNNDAELTEFWWEQSLLDGQVVVTVGQIDQTVYFDGSALANDETSQFLATPLVNSVGVAFPDNGFGVNVWVNATEWLYVTAGFGDANAGEDDATFSDFDGDDLFTALEIGFTPVIEGLGQGNYRFLGWHTRFEGDADVSDGAGFSISADQELGEDLLVFGRYSTGDDEVLDFETFVSAGVGLSNPLGGDGDDLLAVAFAWGDASGGGEETLFEIFYRHQVSDFFSLTPIVQIVNNPLDNADESTVTVVGLRAQLTY